MIGNISTRISKWLLRAGAISENDRELYEYAAYSFLFSLFPLFWIMLLGFAFNMLLDGVLMIIPFMLMRKFSGGFHFRSSGVCLVFSTLLLLAFLFIIRFVTARQCFVLFSFFAAVSAIQIFLCSPIDNEARKLNEKERSFFRKTARIMSALFFVVYIILLLFKQTRFSVPIGAGIILTALLQVPCFFITKSRPA